MGAGRVRRVGSDLRLESRYLSGRFCDRDWVVRIRGRQIGFVFAILFDVLSRDEFV